MESSIISPHEISDDVADTYVDGYDDDYDDDDKSNGLDTSDIQVCSMVNIVSMQ